jgi:hypothetical protein
VPPTAVEFLEDRTLLSGLELVQILPNDGNPLQQDDVRDQAPTELTFQFSPGATVDPNSLDGMGSGIQIVRAGFDGAFGDANDVPIIAGFVGIGDKPNEVIYRFAESLPDDRIQITIFGSGATPLLDGAGDPFNAGVNEVLTFELDLGAQVVAVNPQPVTREQVVTVLDASLVADGDTISVSVAGTQVVFELEDSNAGDDVTPGNTRIDFTSGVDDEATIAAAIAAEINLSGLNVVATPAGASITVTDGAFTPTVSVSATDPDAMIASAGDLMQHDNLIVVHFNPDELDAMSAEDTDFYQLIDTKETLDHTDDTIDLPTGVVYDSVSNTAVLTFAAIPDGTYRLRIGVSDEPSKTVDIIASTQINVNGQGYSGVNPPDTVGDVGISHYVQAINGPNGSRIEIYNKSDGSVAVPQFDLDTLAAGAMGGSPYSGAGDPIVIYDHLDDRWLLMEFDPPGGGNRLHIFISDTGIPTGNGADWTHYRFTAPNFPDYPKITLWPDAYFIGTNEFDNPAYALPRLQMLGGVGGDITANVIRMTTPDRPNWQRNHIMPADLDGFMTPMAGDPGLFVRQVDDEYTTPGTADPNNDFLEVWEFAPDFITPANSTYTLVDTIPIAEFDYIVGSEFFRGDIEQPGTANELDALPHYIMWRLQYRNFGTHETLVGNFTHDVGEDSTADADGGTAAEQAGVRWFELRSMGGGWTLFQEGDIAPDSEHRWMASVAMDGDGNIAAGYNVSSTNVSPGLRYTGRLATDPLGTMLPEKTLVNGGGFNSSERWGDYSAMSVDPVDDTTFWFTGMYTDGTGNWATRIGSFSLPDIIAPSPDDNSSFATATGVGVLAAAEMVIKSQIEPQSIALPPLPGGLDEPGHRDIPVEQHISSTGTDPVLPGPITQVFYNFQDEIGVDPQNNTLFNLINEEQKERAREIFEIYSDAIGVEFIETELQGLIVATGDLRAVLPTVPTGPGGVAGIAGGGIVVMDAAETFNNEYGGNWMRIAFHEIGHSLNLGHSYDIPSIQGGGLTGEPVFTGDHDFVHLKRLHRPDSTDIDLYSFDLDENGVFSAEILAERLTNVSLLNSALTLFDADGNALARNDDYFSNDAFLELELEAGSYFIGVTSTGNLDYDANVSDSGSGGTTDGDYELRLNFVRSPGPGEFLVDTTDTAFDGDADGVPGGVFDFWFQSGETVFVDKANADSMTQDGSLADPFGEIDVALVVVNAANTNATTADDVDIIRIVGNGGADGDLSTAQDALPYLIGIDEDFNFLEDGTTFVVPQDVTVMIDQGAVLKLQNAIIDVGSSSDLIDRSQAALQVLGTPDNQVVFTSFLNDLMGGGDAAPADWGGVVYRADSDLEDDGIFLNFVNQADFSFGGGQVFVDSVLDVFAPVHMIDSRPTVSFNTITTSADAAISASLGSFDDVIRGNRDVTLSRIGPDIHGNRVFNNSVNGMFVAVETEFGDPIDKIDVSARFDDTDIVHVITENVQIVGSPGGPLLDDGVLLARESGRLRIDAGTVVKLSGSRIEAEHGHSNFIAEGTAEHPIIFTSIYDDEFGRGGTFDTTNDDNVPNERQPVSGDWGGIVLNAISTASIDNAVIMFGGGVVPIKGAFANFNVIEAHQADLRLTNSRLESNAIGLSQGDRNGRGTNDDTTVFIRGAQPIIAQNLFINNDAAAISINANSMRSDINRDLGRSTGPVQVISDPLTGELLFPDNHGPLVRLNRFENNGINGMEVRAEELTIESVWDDSDIVHVVRGEIIAPNFHTFGGIRLQSSSDSSLVVKLDGPNAGFTAGGMGLDIDDRIGGIVQIVGQPLRSVVLTSLADDTIGAGFDFSGLPQNDTDNNGDVDTIPLAGDWRGIRLEEFSHDRNVEIVNELEDALLRGEDTNRIPPDAQFLGELAPDEKSGDENRRLGYEVHGFIAADTPGDSDIYSFIADAGTVVWFDIDRTDPTLNAVVELLDPLTNVLARSTDNGTIDSAPTVIADSLTADSMIGGDFYTSSPHDPGMRVVLPGNEGQTSTYFVRVRSASSSPNVIDDGLTTGNYQLQIRLGQTDDRPGSTIRHADIRFATTAIDVIGLPAHSPLVGEAGEAPGPNDTLNQAQAIGNLLTSDRNTISLAGSLDPNVANDVDFYQFTIDYDLIQVIAGLNGGGKTFPTVFDIDYADGASRGDTVVSVFDGFGNLILVGRDSNIDDDEPRLNEGADFGDESRGTVGKLDPFIGSVQMPAGLVTGGLTGTYFVAISSNAQLPTAINATFQAGASNPLIRLEPISSVQRITEDHIGFSGHTTGRFDTITNDMTPETELFDISTSLALSAHVTPFKLSDVVLFVSTVATNARLLQAVDPFSGAFEYEIGALDGGPSVDGFGDIAFRTDGNLFGYTIGDIDADSGNYSLIDTGTAAQTNQGDDGIATVPDVGSRFSAMAFRLGDMGIDEAFAANNEAADVPPALWRFNPDTGAVMDEDADLAGLQPAGPLPTDRVGDITGLAFDGLAGGQLFGVDQGGNLFEMFSDQLIKPDVTGTQVGFTALTLGPQNLQGGQFADMLFGTTTNNELFAFDLAGNLQVVFDTNNDGIADSTSTDISLTGPNSSPNTQITGLAFSPLDINLWHPTMKRRDDDGHGLEPVSDISRSNSIFGNFINGRASSEQEGGASFYFGLEQFTTTPDNAYFTYESGGQLGVLDNVWQQRLTSNADISENYNLPGGALGSLTTDPFSLMDYSYTDKPTLYFNYFLETEGAIGSFTDATMRDSARVFVSADGGNTFNLLATNNSLVSTNAFTAELPRYQTASSAASPHSQQRVQELFDNTGGWRQARVDLGDFVGEESLILRFDFSTAGKFNDPGLLDRAEGFFDTVSGDFFDPSRGEDNQFEGFYIDDIIIGFSERGEMVSAATGLNTFFQVPQNPNTNAASEVLVGPYQLEIRRGEEHGALVRLDAPNIRIFQQFDTNDRLARGITLLAPGGTGVIDGQVFSVRDVAHTIEFEFESSGGVDPGRIPVPFNVFDSPELIANRMVAAINSVNDQLPGLVPDFAVRAGTNGSSNRVELADAVEAFVADTPTIDDLIVTIDADTIPEDGGATTATITRTGDISSPLSVTVTALDPFTGGDSDEVFLDGTNPLMAVMIPAGSSTIAVPIDITARQDMDADGTQTVVVSATAPSFNFNSITDTLDVIDDETPTLVLTIADAMVPENASPMGMAATTGTIAQNMPLTSDMDVIVHSHDPANILLRNPATGETGTSITVTIPAGSPPFTTFDFDLIAVDDAIFEENPTTVAISAFASGYLSDTKTLDVEDAGDLLLVINDSDRIIDEGTMTTGFVRRGAGDTVDTVTIEITSSDPVTGATVTTPVMILATETDSDEFMIFGVADLIADGDQVVTITAAEMAPPVDNLNPDTETITIVDVDDPKVFLEIEDFELNEAFTLSNAPDFVEADGPFATFVRVGRDGDLSDPLAVFVENPDNLIIDLPLFNFVIIPADRTFAEFGIFSHNDAEPTPPDENPQTAILDAFTDPMEVPQSHISFFGGEVKVADNESIFSIEITDDVIMEGESTSVTVRRPFIGESGRVQVDDTPDIVDVDFGNTTPTSDLLALFGPDDRFDTGAVNTTADPMPTGEKLVTLSVLGPTGVNEVDLWIADAQQNSLTVTIDRPTILEDGSQAAVIRVSRAGASIASDLDLTLSLSAGAKAIIEVPTDGFKIKQFDIDATFIMRGVDDNFFDQDINFDGSNNQLVKVTATAPQFNRGIGRILIIEDDQPELELTFEDANGDPLPPGPTGKPSIFETDGVRAAVGRVTISNVEFGVLSEPIRVQIGIQDPTGDPANEVAFYGGNENNPSILNMPAGAATYTFDIDAIDDLIPDGDQDVTITVSGQGFVSGDGFGTGSQVITVREILPVLGDRIGDLIVNVTDTTVLEGGTILASSVTVTRTGDITQALDVEIKAVDPVSVSGADTDEVSLDPDTGTSSTRSVVRFLAGESVATSSFAINGLVDLVPSGPWMNIGLADGTQPVLFDFVRARIVGATADANLDDYALVTDSIDVIDIETPTLHVTIDPNSIDESAGPGAAFGTVSRNTPNNEDLVVTLISSDLSEATVPDNVTIFAGTDIATFAITAIDELISDGVKGVTITVAAPKIRSDSDDLDVRATSNVLSYNRLGDSNLFRDQGQLLIHANFISNALVNAISVDASAREAGSNLSHPGVAINLPTLNDQSLARSVVIENNVIHNFGVAGIVFSGDPNTGNVSTAVVPFGKLVNNTLYGGETAAGIGILVSENASPTLLNNIVANTDTAISIDATSTTTIVGTTLFQGNNDDATRPGIARGAFDIQLNPGDPLFIDPASGNFYLANGSLAIDSSLNRLADRPEIVGVGTPLEIPPSDIFAPGQDIFGQTRVDDPAQAPPPGLGFNIFKDRGAIEHADFDGPIAVLIEPEDNDAAKLDKDDDPTEVFLVAPVDLSAFVVKLDDRDGIGIDDSLVTSSRFEVLRAGILLTDGIDYLFSYNANTDTVRFISTLSSFPIGSYTIDIDRSPSTGVKDLAGNLLEANQPDGPLVDKTQFTIVLGPAISIDDVVVDPEGDSGTTTADFTVTLSAAADVDVTVDFATSDGTAMIADNDYDALPTTTLTFTPGETSKTISVVINGDEIDEFDEDFFVDLSNASVNALLLDNQGMGTIVNDDDPDISITDVSEFEGDSGSQNFDFVVSLSNPSNEEITLDVFTVDGTATEPGDYTAVLTTPLTFTTAGPLMQTVSVSVNGDLDPELDETFTVMLDNVVGNGIGSVDDMGLGTILDDEPHFTIDDVTLLEGDTGTKAFEFTVTLSELPTADLTIDVTTIDDTATVANSDYDPLTPNPTTLMFSSTTGPLSQTVTVDVIGDFDPEDDETFIVELSNLSNPLLASIHKSEGLGTILNDDPKLRIDDVIINPEGDAGTKIATFTVSLLTATTDVVMVDVVTANGTATAGSDYVAVPLTTLTFNPLEVTQTVDVTIVSGTVVEDDETFFVNLSNPVNAFIDDGQGMGTIVNDDMATISIDNVSLAEGNSSMTAFTFTVSIDKVASKDITVRANTLGVTATGGGTDFADLTNELVTIAAGSTSTTVMVNVTGEQLVELDETFQVNLTDARFDGATDATRVIIGTSQGIGEILNDDTATISIGNVSLAEGDSSTTAFQFTVSIDNTASEDITVRANTLGVTATGGGTDFADLTNELVTIAAGSTSMTVTVDVTGEKLVEFDETFEVNLTDAMFDAMTDPTRATIGDSQGIGEIINDDVATISIDNVSLAEGDSSTTAFEFTVSIDNMAVADITVRANTLGVTATGGGTDFANVTNQLLTIAAGTSSTTVTVDVTGDMLVEPDETFEVNLTDAQFDGATDATRATIGDSQGIGTIENDETATISINNVTLPEGNSSTTAFQFTVSIDKTASEDITVRANTLGVDATGGGTDFADVTNQLLTIAAGSTSTTVTVDVTGEMLVEDDETFQVNLTDPQFGGVTDATLADIGVSQGIGEIVNDDKATISIGNVSLAEGDAGTTAFEFTVSIDKAASKDITVRADTFGVTATGGGTDFADLTNELVTIAAGSTSTTVTVDVTGETLVELNETFEVNLTDAQFDGATDATRVMIGNSQGIGTIENDDKASITIDNVSMAEGDSGTTEFEFTVSIDNMAAEDITVRANTLSGSATGGGVDFANVTNQLVTITAGSTSAMVTVDVTGEMLVEPDETFTVNLTDARFDGMVDATRATIGVSPGTGTIVNDDMATISIDNVSLTEGDSSTTEFEFTVSIDKTASENITVVANTGLTLGEPATGGGVDFDDVLNQLLTIAAGTTSTTVTVDVIGEMLVEADETFAVDLTDARFDGATDIKRVIIGDTQGIGTIENDDSTTITIDNVSLAEGNSSTTAFQFTVSIDEVASKDITVRANTLGVTADGGGVDFTDLTNQLVTITAGTMSTMVTVNVTGELVQEDDETFQVNLTDARFDGVPDATRVTFDDDQGIGTIEDDDSPTISIDNVMVLEGDNGAPNFAVFTVALSHAGTRAIDVDFATADDTANVGVDYVDTSGSLTFSIGGDLWQQILVPINGDVMDESDETFFVNLTSPIHASLSVSQGTATIKNDDDPFLKAAAGQGPGGAAILTEAELASVVDQAVARWAATDLTQSQQNALNQVTFEIMDESDDRLGVTTLSVVSLDVDAAGWGWFVDASPADDQEFATYAGGSEFSAASGSPAFGKMDLLTAVMHELGHVLGYIDISDPQMLMTDTLTTGSRRLPPSTSSIAIDDVSLAEGDSGTAAFQFTVSIDHAANKDITVRANTLGVTAVGGGADFANLTNQLVTIAAGTTSTTVTVNVNGETLVEPDETFQVNLTDARFDGVTDATAAIIGDSQGIGTIENDDTATITIDDVSLTEGNSGVTAFQFTVSIDKSANRDITVLANTLGVTAVGGGADFANLTNQLVTIAAGMTSKTVTVSVNGDTLVEPDETFQVNLTNARI